MKTQVDTVLTEIAQKYLYIDTLETRFSDRLDFHEVGVQMLKSALKSAYYAGARSEKEKSV